MAIKKITGPLRVLKPVLDKWQMKLRKFFQNIRAQTV
jgi:hypothetical protein